MSTPRRRPCSPSRATTRPPSPLAPAPTSSAGPAEPSAAFPANSESRKIETAVDRLYAGQVQSRRTAGSADGESEAVRRARGTLGIAGGVTPIDLGDVRALP